MVPFPHLIFVKGNLFFPWTIEIKENLQQLKLKRNDCLFLISQSLLVGMASQQCVLFWGKLRNVQIILQYKIYHIILLHLSSLYLWSIYQFFRRLTISYIENMLCHYNLSILCLPCIIFLCRALPFNIYALAPTISHPLTIRSLPDSCNWFWATIIRNMHA